MRLDQEYHNSLLAFALSSKEWTAIAQAELFRNIILKNRSKTVQFLKLVRENKELRRFADSATSIRFGGEREVLYEAAGLGDDLDEIALYCPTVVEISCYRVDVRLEYFRNMKKLDKLNITLGSILPPSNPGAPIQPVRLPITLLSLFQVNIPSSLNPSSLPLLRSLHLNVQAWQTIRLLLPQLASLRVESVNPIADINLLIQASTSITSLTLYEQSIAKLNDGNKTIITDQIVDFGIVMLRIDGHGGDACATLIAGSKAMKKVILDGHDLGLADQVTHQHLETLTVVKEACKKKGVELWTLNTKVGKGNWKVDLEK